MTEDNVPDEGTKLDETAAQKTELENLKQRLETLERKFDGLFDSLRGD